MVRIFYSWQEKCNLKENKIFIKEVLDDLIKDLNVIYPKTYSITQDIAGHSGTIYALEAIQKKIDACSVFICDLTIVNPEAEEKFRMPSANVMLELGYAASRLSFQHVIAICNTDNGDFKTVPSDILGKYIVGYSLKNGNKNEVKAKLKTDIRERLPRPEELSYNIQLQDMVSLLCDKPWIAIGKNDHTTTHIDMSKTYGEVKIGHVRNNHFNFEYIETNQHKWWGELFLNQDFLRTGKIIWQSDFKDYGYKEIFVVDNVDFYTLFINPINIEGQKITYKREVLRRYK